MIKNRYNVLKIIINLIIYSVNSNNIKTMNITFEELRSIKHSLPTGSVSKIANELGIDQQTVRNYFGAQKFSSGVNIDRHLQPGPDGGIVSLQDTTILEAAKRIIADSKMELEEV